MSYTELTASQTPKQSLSQEDNSMMRYLALSPIPTPAHLPLGTTVYFVEDNGIYEGKINSVEIRTNLYSQRPHHVQYSVSYIRNSSSTEPYLSSVYRIDHDAIATSKEELVAKLLSNG